MESQQRCIRTLKHSASSLSFTSDGKTLVSFNRDDKTAKLWDVNTGELKKDFTGLRSLALSLDGKTLAGSNDDKLIKLWDVETDELKTTLTGHLSVVDFIAFSPNGKTLVSRDRETIKLWDVKTGELRSTIAEGFNKCWGSIFSPNGQTLAIATSGWKQDRTVYNNITLWNVGTGQLIRTLDDISGWLVSGSLAFSHDGKTLFFGFDKEGTNSVSYPDGGSDSYQMTYCRTQLLDLTTGQISKTFDSRFCALSPDGQILIGVGVTYYSAGDRTTSINIINVGMGKIIQSFQGTSAALSPDGKILAVSEDGQALKLLDWSSQTSIATLPGRIKNFSFSPDGNILAVSDGSTIKLWQESTVPVVKQRLHGDAYPNLERLENLLAAELWEDADRETIDVIKRFPSQDLNVVDQLWVHYSNGRYGFSVQKRIWEGVLDNDVRRMGMRRMDKNRSLLGNYEQFECCVGWSTVRFNPFFYGENDEYFADAWEKTSKGYYPREFYQGKRLLEVFDMLREDWNPPSA